MIKRRSPSIRRVFDWQTYIQTSLSIDHRAGPSNGRYSA